MSKRNDFFEEDLYDHDEHPYDHHASSGIGSMEIIC